MLLIIIFSVLFLLMMALQARMYLKIKKQLRYIELQQQKQDNQKKLVDDSIEEKQQLIGLVSHDLKGPFNRIFALTQLLSMSSNNFTEEQFDYIGKIHQISSDGLALLRNLLDNRRLEDKGIDLMIEKINFSIKVSNLVKNYRTLAEKKKINILLEKEDNLMIMSDTLSINRIVENLISNAMKFSPQGRNIYVKLFQQGDFYELAIIDEGPGIGLEDQKKLFQKYQRLSARPTAGESSTGLGLYLVKNMVEKIGGRISYSGEIGKGSQFKVQLPIEIKSTE
jgi:signal transduction histidine kinase